MAMFGEKIKGKSKGCAKKKKTCASCHGQHARRKRSGGGGCKTFYSQGLKVVRGV